MSFNKLLKQYRLGHAIIFLTISTSAVYAQNYQGYTPTQPVASYPPVLYAPPVAATPQVVASLTAQQIDQLVAPVALYPDPLLAQLLPAATYPQQVVLAAQWLQINPTPSEIMINMQNWDPSIKAMVHYPTVLAYMDANMAWTQALGVAFLNQQTDVMQAIQQLRAQALTAGTLQSTPQQEVISQNGVIWIEPVNPQTIYVPQYDPNLVYNQQSGYVLTFSSGYAIGPWLNYDCDWQNRWVSIGQGWRNNWRRDNQGRWIRINQYNRGKRWAIGPARPVSQRWTRDARQPFPTLPPSMVQRGAMQQYRGWSAPQPAKRQDSSRSLQARTNQQRAGEQRVNNYASYVPPSGVFGGTYRSDNNVSREENRGHQSMQSYQGQQNRDHGNRSQSNSPRQERQQQAPAFQNMNSGEQTQQDSQRGQQSMRHRH